MSLKYLAVAKRRDELVADVMDRGPVLAFAVAYMLSSRAPLPTSPVEDPAMWFRINCQQEIRTAISAINENIVFNTHAAMDAARANWMMRYSAAHTRVWRAPTAADCYDFYCAIFGADVFVSVDDYQFQTKHRRAICDLAWLLQDAFDNE